MTRKTLSEADICAKYITPAVVQAGWDEASQIRRGSLFHQRPHHRARQAGHARQGEARRLRPLLPAHSRSP